MRDVVALAQALDQAVAWCMEMHRTVDHLAEEVARHHGDLITCRRGCAGCCVDDLTVFEVEAELIRRVHGSLLRDGTPHAPGACAYLDAEGACRIYEARPYVCRTQGLPLRWLETDETDGDIEARDVCPLNLEGASLEALSPEAMWTLGPVEQRLAQRQHEVDGGLGTRVALRALFEHAPGGSSKRKLPVAPTERS